MSEKKDEKNQPLPKKKHHEEHEEHPDESWLVPYADILTLLLALFIVLFATSKVDQTKLEQMSATFQQIFGTGGGTVGVFEGSTAPINNFINKPPNTTSIPQKVKDYESETEQLNALKSMLDVYIELNNLGMQLDTELTERGLAVVIRDTTLFTPGTADLLPESYPIADNIAKVLASLEQQIIISGHTDSSPINSARYPSNWELSSQRAINFMKYLLAREPSLKPERFSATGYAQYRPIANNRTAEGRARNRRVEIMILRSFPKIFESNLF